MKEVKEKDGQILSPLLFSSLTMWLQPQQEKMDMISIKFTLLFNLFPTSSELIFITQPDGESQ
jgi:hypothetical protein